MKIPLSINPSIAARRRRVCLLLLLGLALGFVFGNIGVRPKTASAHFDKPTYSSPIAMSADNRLVWVVNPDDDSVSVIRTDTNTIIKKIVVGDEPQSVALDPDDSFAYVANAAASTVTVIRIANPDPDDFEAGVARRNGVLRTGAEPWNIVVSPNGKRIFVANSGQDTITVIDGRTRNIIGHVNLRNSVCNDPDRNRHFQPRGLAVTEDNTKLYVTRFLSFTKAGGKQGDDNGKEGLVCRLNIDTDSLRIADYRPAAAIPLASRVTGFTVDSTGDGTPDPTSAFPNQIQSIVIRGNQAYLPNIAASPAGPVRFNVNTQAFVNVIDGVNGSVQSDGSAARFLNLHLGARDPEPGKKRLFFSNPWAVAFTNQSGAGTAYVVSAGSDLLVKVNVAADGKLNFTGDENTTRYIDLNDPANPATSGANAGKNPLGIVINDAGDRAYVMNFVSRNVSVVNLTNDSVVQVIKTTNLPSPGSPEEVIAVGAEMFFSSRGNFNRPAGTTVSTTDRLSSEGWQNCASCHFQGWTDGVVWSFAAGPRKSVPLNASFNPNDPNNQRLLNYSAIFDEIEDFELNIRNVSGPGALAAAVLCSDPAPGMGTFDPNHGLLIGDNGNLNLPPCTINAFAKPNAARPQHTVTLPGSNVAVPALTALKEWVRFAVRTPNGPLTANQVQGGVSRSQIVAGRALFVQAGCAICHSGGKWTLSTKEFTSPPAAAAVFTERTGGFIGNPVGAQYFASVLRDIGSFNLGVPGQNNLLGANIGAEEKAAPGLALVSGVLTSQPAQDALGRDYNNDSNGNGFNVPSLLGIHALPPYYHNGSCETLACVVGNPKHRTANGTMADLLPTTVQQALVVRFLESINARTIPPFEN